MDHHRHQELRGLGAALVFRKEPALGLDTLGDLEETAGWNFILSTAVFRFGGDVRENYLVHFGETKSTNWIKLDFWNTLVSSFVSSALSTLILGPRLAWQTAHWWHLDLMTIQSHSMLLGTANNKAGNFLWIRVALSIDLHDLDMIWSDLDPDFFLTECSHQFRM